MMRQDLRTFDAAGNVGDFRQRFPLGSTTRVILVDKTSRYAGLVLTAAAFADDIAAETPIADLAILKDAALSPDQDIEAVLRAFAAAEADDLVVVDEEGRLLGLVGETYATRRYATELERQHLDLYGEARP
jgi:CIC family chloride channel protein